MGTATGNNSCQRAPGPKPIFVRRVVVKLRRDQHEAVQRIARTLGLSASDVVRWWIDEGIRAVEGVPEFRTLEGVTSDEAES